MKKVLVIGMSGSGKSTIAIKLGRILRLPVIHLDNHFHISRDETVKEQEWDRIVAKLVKRQEWVMDGFYPRTLDIRLKEADTIIFLDLPKWVTVPRLIRAGIRGLKNGRVGQPRFLRNKLSGPLFKKVIGFSREDLLQKLNKYKGKEIIVLKNDEQIKNFLEKMNTDSKI